MILKLKFQKKYLYRKNELMKGMEADLSKRSIILVTDNLNTHSQAS